MSGRKIVLLLAVVCVGLPTYLYMTRDVIYPPAAEFQGHTSAAFFVAASPEGNTLVSASCDRTIMIWDVASRKERATIRGHIDMGSVALSPDGKILASVEHQDNSINLWEVATGKKLATLRSNTRVHDLAFSPDGRILASGGREVKFWDVAAGKELNTLREHERGEIRGQWIYWINCVAFSPDGKTMASGGTSETLKLWDVTTRKERITLQERGYCMNGPTALTFSPDGTILASGDLYSVITLWDVATGTMMATLGVSQGDTPVGDLTFSADGKTLVAVENHETVRLWDIANLKNTATFEYGWHSHPLRTLGYLGNTVADSFPAIFKDKKDDLSVCSVLIRPDGNVVALGTGYMGNQKTVKTWQVAALPNGTK